MKQTRAKCRTRKDKQYLVGYGSSASTIGANHAGAAAAKELMAFLGEEKDSVVANIGRDDLRTRMDRGDPLILLEVLPLQYYRHSLARSVEPSAWQGRRDGARLAPDKEAEIVLYCWDQRDPLPCRPPVSWWPWATQTCGKMRRVKAWIAAGLPVEGRSRRPRQRG